MANKTKKELLEDVERLEQQLRDTREDLRKYEYISSCANMAEEYKLIYDNYVKAGFTEGMAETMLLKTMDHTLPYLMTNVRGSRVSYRSYY